MKNNISSVCFLLLIGIFCFLSCSKIEKMKEKLFPERPYEESQTDNFYWADSGWDYVLIPLVKPYQLIKLQGKEEWELSTGFNKFGEIGIYNIKDFNIKNNYIYGYKATDINESDPNYNVPEYWYLINLKKSVKVEDSALITFRKESDFKKELKKLNLPEEFLTPDEVYEQYKNDPVLPWFPEDIKRQLEEAKAKHEK